MSRRRLAGLALAVGLAGVIAPGGPARTADLDAMPGPRVMLCLYGADGTMLAGHADCPPRVRPEDAMLADAHCFYDADGRLWRGLPRCPRMAPPFLMEEADTDR